MNLTADRNAFITGRVFNSPLGKSNANGEARAAFYDYCAAFEGEELPPPAEVAARFKISIDSVKRWSVEIGVPYPRRAQNSANDFYNRVLDYLRDLKGTTTLAELLKALHMSHYSLRYYKVLERIKKNFPELASKLEPIKRGRRRVLPCNSRRPGTTAYEKQRARVLAVLKINPAGGCLNAARFLRMSLPNTTHHARKLAEEGLVPESVLRVDARRAAAAYKQWLKDWNDAPAEVRTLRQDDACYMYGVELEDLASFEFNSGYYLDYHKKELATFNDGTGREAVRIAEALVDALDRKATFRELAMCTKSSEPALRRFAFSGYGHKILQFIDVDAPEDREPALTYNGDFLEGAGVFSAPEAWQKEIKERGGMGVNLTGGFWRRYYEIFQHRQKGETFKNGRFIPLGALKKRKGALLD